MSGDIHGEESVRTSVPLADMTVIDEAITQGPEALKAAVKRMRPADLGAELSRRPIAEGKLFFEAYDDRRRAAMLRAAHPTVSARILAECDPATAARVIGFLPTEDRVKVMRRLPPESHAEIDKVLPPEDRDEIDRMLRLPEYAIGRLMSHKIWRCERTATVGDSLAYLREHKDEIEVAPNLYVTEDGRLVGVIPLREVAILPLETPVETVMTRNPIAVAEDSERGDAAELVRRHNFLSLPIIDKDGKLLGAVRVDDIFDAALSKIGAGLLNQGGVSGKIAANVPYFQTRIRDVVRSRITWLILLFVAETATGTVLRHFEDELAVVVALSFFIPLLIGTGGNAGSQTVSTIIRALALGEVRMKDVLRVLVKELSSGALLGLLLGIIAFVRGLMWGVSPDIAMCVGVTVLVVCTWANLVGSIIPIAAQRFKIDPTVVSAPLITTLVDASGLFIYLTIAHFMVAALAFHTDHNVLVLPAPIVFANGPDDLLADSEPILQRVKSYLKSNPQVTTMRIEGHVDEEGKSDDEAQALSEKRALAAKTWLVEHEVVAGRLLPVGFGRKRPLSSEKTKEAREKNTRITFVIAAKDGRPVDGAVDGGGKVVEEPKK